MEQLVSDTPPHLQRDDLVKGTNITRIGSPGDSQDGDTTDYDTSKDQGTDNSGSENAGDEDGLAANSRRLLEIENSSSSSHLENLPVELRIGLLMYMPDLPTLRSLVHASPIMHAQYLHSRNSILCACLGRELNGCFVDAYATLMSRVHMIGSPRTDEKITHFLDAYRGWISGSSPPPDLNSINPSCMRWMAAYHLSFAQPLAHSYSTWALANLSKVASPSANEEAITEAAVKLRRNEEIRIFRALYRYDTFHHLFGRNRGKRRGAFRHNEINELFFCLFNPWEADAVGCIDLFVRQKYEDIFNEVKWDLDPRNDRFRQENGVYNPNGSFDLTAEHDDYMDGTVSRGLKMIGRLLAITEHEKLVAKMVRCLTHDQCLDAPMRKAMWTASQCDRRTMSPNFPNARDEAEERRDPISFVGDAVPPDGPPLAWVLLWNGKYANLYGEYVPESIRRCGYVMWDERRLTDMGAKELMKTQWEMAPKLAEEIMMDYDWSPVESSPNAVEMP